MGTERMPSTLPRSNRDPRRCAQLLGELIHGVRALDDRPLGEIAPLAALTVEEWLAIEAGDVSYAWKQILLIGQALHCGPMWMSYLAKFYKGAKQQ